MRACCIRVPNFILVFFHFPSYLTCPPLSHAFVYILACEDGSLYIGSARDLAKRLTEHGGHRDAKFTRDHPGGRLVYIDGPFSDFAALKRERQLKRWSRAKKLALIRNQTAALQPQHPSKLVR